jgi:hypothetical protein
VGIIVSISESELIDCEFSGAMCDVVVKKLKDTGVPIKGIVGNYEVASGSLVSSVDVNTRTIIYEWENI